MKLTIAATFATLLIAGFAITPASAAVKQDYNKIDITEQVLKMELQGDYGLQENTEGSERVATN